MSLAGPGGLIAEVTRTVLTEVGAVALEIPATAAGSPARSALARPPGGRVRVRTTRGGCYPATTRLLRNAWEQFTPSLPLPPQIRKIVYATKAIESLNSRI